MAETAMAVVSGLRKGALHELRHVRERCRAVLLGENGGLFRFDGRVGAGLFAPDVLARDARLDTLAIDVEDADWLSLFFIPLHDTRERPAPLDLDAQERQLTFRVAADGIELLGSSGRLACFSDRWLTELGRGELLVGPPTFFVGLGLMPHPIVSTRRGRPSSLAEGEEAN